MPSTATPNLRLELQAPGENSDTWGTKLNTVIQLVEDAVSKRTVIALSNVDVTLTANNFAADQGRCLCLNFTGILSGNVNVIVPSLSHFYLVQNQCTGGFTVTVKTLAGTGVVASTASTSAVYCDGTNVAALGSEPFYPVTAAELTATAVVLRTQFQVGDIRRYCTAAEANHSQAFIYAHAAAKVIYAPDSTESPTGTWNVDHFQMNINGRRLKTDGFATVIKQRTGNLNRRIIEVSDSNVQICTLTLMGNIAVDTSEQQHGIFLNGTTVVNTIIGDVIGQDIRGDVILVSANVGQTIKNVKIGHVQCNNILRNGVALAGVTGVTIDSIEGTAIGYMSLDIEPDAFNSGPVVGVKVGNIRGRSVSVSGVSATKYCDQIDIANLDLDPTYTSNSTPAYSGTLGNTNGLLLRNVKTMRVGAARFRSFNSSGLACITNVGELGTQSLTIDALDIALCSLTDTTRNAYVICDNINQFTVGSVKADVTVTGGNAKILFRMPNSIHIKNAVVTLGAGCGFMRDGVQVLMENGVVTGGILVNANSAGQLAVKNFTFNGEQLCLTSDKGTWEGCTITTSGTVFTSGSDHHFLMNTTLNGDYYFHGSPITDFTTAIRFGAVYLWVDPTGNKVRIKGSPPVSNTDGTIVGTQS